MKNTIGADEVLALLNNYLDREIDLENEHDTEETREACLELVNGMEDE